MGDRVNPDPSYLYVVHGYNHRRYKGNLEEFRRTKEGPLPYDPAHLPTTPEMMKLSDKEFILVYSLHMIAYRDDGSHQFPVRCGGVGCGFIINHPIDLRRFYGLSLCPKCFVDHVEKEGKKADPYLKRAARLLPDRPLSIPYWPNGVLAEDNQA